MDLSRLPREKRLLVARLFCIGCGAMGLWYCVFAALLARTQQGQLLNWQGMLQRPPPVPMPVLLVAGAILTPLLVAFARGVTGAGQSAYDEVTREPVSDEAYGKWMSRQILFYGIAGTPSTASLALAALFGLMPLLWLVAGESLVMFLLYMPKARDLDPEAS